ncbi:MAG: peptide ABC transporter substrate-binding protein [Bdellovibrionota bacterium]
MKKLIVMGMVALSLTACTKKNADGTSAGSNAEGARSSGLTNKELKIGISQEFENLNPLIMNMVATTYMHRMVNRTLVNLDADAKWVAQLAKEIPTIENGKAKFVTVGGKKKMTATWEIIEAAKWGDGTPVTCADFALSRKIAESPNVSIAEKETFTLVEKIEWDPKTPKVCNFTYEKARWDYYQLAQFYPLPSHLETEVFAKNGGQKEGYEKNSNYVKNPTNPGLYHGPYVVSEVQLGNYVAFKPNPHFYGEKPKIERVIVKVIPNTGTLEANLRSGTIDMISTLGLTMDQALAFDKKVKSESLPYNVTFTPSITYEHIDLNLSNPLLKDLKVRQALVYAINREDLTKSLFEGRQPVSIHFLSPKDPWFTDDPTKIKTYKYSRRDAEKLLDEAGWKPGPDGIRVKDGKRLSLNFQTTAGNKVRELVQVYLQEQWKQIGVEVSIKNEQARVFFSETTKKRKFDMAMYAWMASPENSPRSTQHSKSIPAEKNGYSGQNQPGWINAGVDKAIDDLDVEFDAGKRKSLVEGIAKAYTEDVPVIPLYYRADISVAPVALKNYRPPGHQFPETNEIEKWTVE